MKTKIPVEEIYNLETILYFIQYILATGKKCPKWENPIPYCITAIFHNPKQQIKTCYEPFFDGSGNKKYHYDKVYFITGRLISNRLGVAAL